jgi:glycosyltransferase involved in cell wall biosynthesis
MKIAQVIATFPPYHGGMGYICFHNSLELARRGHEVTVFTLDHGQMTQEEDDPQEFRVVRLKSPLLSGDAGMVPQLLSLLKGFDIIHLHYPFFGGAEYVYLAATRLGIPYFLTYHMDVFGNSLFKRFIIWGYELLLMQKIIGSAHGINAPGSIFLKSTKAAGFTPWDRVHEIGYGGVDTDRFSPRPKDPRLLEQYGLAGKTVALFVGNLIPFKGLHLLITALAGIKNDTLMLLVVGGGYNEAEYRKQVQELGLQDRVVFAGPQHPAGLLPDHFNLGDFLVLPSTHSESFGLVILEAMASGIPAIVSSLPGPAQLVEAGRDGLLVKTGEIEDLQEKIAYLALHPEKIREMGSAARQKVTGRYGWDKIGEQLEQAFEQILISSGSSPRVN